MYCMYLSFLLLVAAYCLQFLAVMEQNVVLNIFRHMCSRYIVGCYIVGWYSVHHPASLDFFYTVFQSGYTSLLCFTIKVWLCQFSTFAHFYKRNIVSLFPSNYCGVTLVCVKYLVNSWLLCHWHNIDKFVIASFAHSSTGQSVLLMHGSLYSFWIPALCWLYGL